MRMNKIIFFKNPCSCINFNYEQNCALGNLGLTLLPILKMLREAESILWISVIWMSLKKYKVAGITN
jgi:hypothetical protein